MSNTTGWGGKRAGAGRPKGTTKDTSVQRKQHAVRHGLQKIPFWGKSVHHMGSAFFMPAWRQLQYVTMLCQFLDSEIDTPRPIVVQCTKEVIDMAFSIRLNEEERKLVDSYAKLHSMTVGEAFKRALFERIDEEYDRAVFEEAYRDYVKDGKKSRPISELWKEVGV